MKRVLSAVCSEAQAVRRVGERGLQFSPEDVTACRPGHLTGRLLSSLLVILAPVVARANENWPQFRGPNGDGQSDAKGLPLTWSETENVKWKTPIHGKAWSCPVVWGNQVWLTTATEDGRELFVVCVDRDTGKILRDQKLFDVANPQFCHKFNSYASPTPVIEEGRIYVTFGSPGTACLDTQIGKVLWERRDLECNHFRGAGSSLILYGNLLIMNFDGSDHQFIVALDKKTGKTVWRKNRSIDYKDLGPDGKPELEGDLRKAFATPHVASLDGKPVLISSGAKAHYAYEPLTGEELWRVEERSSHSAGARPVVGHALVFIPTGWSQGQILAIQPGRKGEVIDANATAAEASGSNEARTRLQVVWKSKRSVPKKPSLLLVDDLLFMVDDGGIAGCLEAKTGAEVWRERVGGNYSASPIYAEGRIYFFSEEGKTTVIEAGRQFKKITENQLDDGFMASAAIAGKALFLRTKTHLYRIEK
jgi:outer membrane protein assembly factor BamB